MVTKPGSAENAGARFSGGSARENCERLRSPQSGRLIRGSLQYVCEQQIGREKDMKFRPLHDRVLVRRIEEAETVRGGIIIPDSAKEKPQEGEAVACGNGKVLDNGLRVALDVHPGDRVLFGKYGGNEIKLEGEEYLILREDEILGILDKNAKSEKKGKK